MTVHSRLWLGIALAPFARPAIAQQAPPPPSAVVEPAPTDPTDDSEGDAIVVTGTRARGSVVGDIPPESTLNSRDVRATGATNISELLAALAPQIGSAQGRGGEAPVLLLDGKRVSGLRELRDIPVEAIERVDILPEEVALKYGFGADQKVVNVVLRPRFRSTAVQAGATVANDGGYSGGVGDITRLMIGPGSRTTFNLHAEGNGRLTENQRDIIIAPPTSGTLEDALAARTLLPAKRDLRGTATVNRTIFGDVSATINGEVEHQDSHALVGLGQTLLLPLARATGDDSAHLGFALNGTKSAWMWALTGNGDLDRSVTRTDRDRLMNPNDRSREMTRSGDVTGTANGKLFKLPAGDASATFTLAGDSVHLASERRRLGTTADNSLGRSSGRAAVSLDLPISRRNRGFSALGNLTLNANAQVARFSDFGTLTKVGAGLNWSLVDRLNLLGSWAREDGAPTIQQLGDPILDTPGARIFDFVTGQTVLADVITGGNPALRADRRSVIKLGANWQPFAQIDLRLRGDFVQSRIDHPIQALFGPTAAIEAAFPDRFVRDSAGQLISADLRPVNFDEARRDTLRVGFDFTKPLKSKRPSQSVIDQLRSQFGRDRGPGGGPEAGTSPPSQAGGGGGGDRGRGFGGRGGGFGGGSRGRLQLSVTDTITFVDKVSIGPGLPTLDYLHGEAAGASGGTPRHKVEAHAGWSNNGFGGRLSANWRSATSVEGLNGDGLHFSPLATFDLRLFANPGDRPEWVIAHPWLRGTQLRLQIDNLFDSKPQVRDAAGLVPLSYQPDLLDPLGRTIMISIRKLFSPPPGSYRREPQGSRTGGE